MATAYFINATPTDVTIRLNTGDLHDLDPLSVSASKNAVTGPAWGAQIKAFLGKNVFAGDDNDNELLYSSEQSGKTHRYKINSSVSTTLDLYFFMFEDTIIGEDQTGSSDGIIIEREETVNRVLGVKGYKG